jgi:hypothetical protein
MWINTLCSVEEIFVYWKLLAAMKVVPGCHGVLTRVMTSARVFDNSYVSDHIAMLAIATANCLVELRFSPVRRGLLSCVVPAVVGSIVRLLLIVVVAVLHVGYLNQPWLMSTYVPEADCCSDKRTQIS